MPRRLVTLVLAFAVLAVFARGVAWPAWEKVSGTRSGKDFATYHYAVQVAAAGADPYDKAKLNAAAKKEGIRKTVNPYFYPPPFLLSMLWDRGLSLPMAYRIYFFVDLAALLACFAMLRRWLSAPLPLLAILLVTWTPIPDNLVMGQANLVVLALAIFGLWRRSGLAVGTAAMFKMSPALYLFGWLSRRRWRPVLTAVGAAVGLSLASLPLVGPAEQWRFFTQVLPAFAGGPYHELSVPITLEANHSIPDLLRQIWPGPDNYTLSTTARLVSQGITLLLLGGLMALGRRRPDRLGVAALWGAFTVLMVQTPVYTYEHHLIFLLLPWTVAAICVQRGRLPRWSGLLVLLCYALTAWPLSWRDAMKHAAPALVGLIRETKTFGSLGLGALCAWAVWRSPPEQEMGPAGAPLSVSVPPATTLSGRSPATRS